MFILNSQFSTASVKLQRAKGSQFSTFNFQFSTLNFQLPTPNFQFKNYAYII